MLRLSVAHRLPDVGVDVDVSDVGMSGRGEQLGGFGRMHTPIRSVGTGAAETLGVRAQVGRVVDEHPRQGVSVVEREFPVVPLTLEVVAAAPHRPMLP